MDYWYRKQLRILQTVLREIDIVDYDAEAVVGYMEKSGSNVLIVNAGGIVDFFHNEIELAHWNPFMERGQEILADICAACHRAGFHVIVRVDFRGVQKYRYEAHPDWFAANADGSPKINPQGLYSPCYLGEYANGHAVRFIRSLMGKFPVDGIWENSVAFGSQVCYCKTCRDAYRADTGNEIPQSGDYASAVFAPYRSWKSVKAREHIRRLRAAVKESGEDKAFAAEVFGIYHASSSFNSGIDTYAAADFDFIVGTGFLTGAPNGKPYDDLSYAASAVRFLKAVDPKKQTVLLTGNNGTRWRLVKDPHAETRLWMWEAASVGANFWNCLFNGQHPDATVDRRNAYVEADAYGYLKENEKILAGQAPVMDAAIFFSKATRDFIGSDDESRDGYGVGIKGLESVLVDAHIPYGFVTDRGFCAESLRGVKILCIPNGACLSEAEIAVVRGYVRSGGSLLAGFETSLYDENCVRRNDFGLTDVFGVSSTGLIKNTETDCYQMVRAPDHPLLAGMNAGKTRFFINGGKTLLVTPKSANGETVCTYIPMIPNQYPEQAWIRTEETDFPTVYANRFGNGRVVYFANQMEACVYKNGHEDFFDLVRNAFNWLAPELSLQTDAPDSVHVGLTKGLGESDKYVLAFVNVASSGRRTIKKVSPTRPFSVSLTVPASRLEEFRTLFPKTGADITPTRAENVKGALRVVFTVPSFEEFFSVYIAVS
ncbi:MAG: alpha-amylase family protein [Treponemataceae bacterium]